MSAAGLRGPIAGCSRKDDENCRAQNKQVCAVSFMVGPVRFFWKSAIAITCCCEGCCVACGISSRFSTTALLWTKMGHRHTYANVRTAARLRHALGRSKHDSFRLFKKKIAVFTACACMVQVQSHCVCFFLNLVDTLYFCVNTVYL